tara:strand:+ start:1417 stop:2604 length:1188 start_codon:yes stop_codon:yes gene_type:complete
MQSISRLILLILLFPLFLSSHQRSESYSNWNIEIQDEVLSIKTVFSVRESVLLNLNLDDISTLENYLINSISFSDCELNDLVSKLSYREGLYKFSINQECFLEESDEFLIKNDAFFDLNSSHSHIAKIKINNKAFPEKIFLNSDRVLKINLKTTDIPEESLLSSFISYFGLGLEHISTGFDHLAFLLGLLLINRKFKNILIAITGFTLGHTLSFCLAVLGLISPASSFVEATIGFSIFILGIEYLSKNKNVFAKYLFFMLVFWALFLFSFYKINGNNLLLGYLGLMVFGFSYLALSKNSKSLLFSLLITSLFGLVHGFGFGGYLSEVGLPENKLYLALIGFNLGVELGQIIAALIFLFLLYVIKGLKFINKNIVETLLAISLVSVGVFWFIERSF